MRIAKFKKDQADRKRYEVNYEDWLNEGEVIEGVTMQGNVAIDAFFVDGFVVDADMKEVIFYVSGGLPGVSYEVEITITTSLQQVKNDTITFVVV